MAHLVSTSFALLQRSVVEATYDNFALESRKSRVSRPKTGGSYSNSRHHGLAKGIIAAIVVVVVVVVIIICLLLFFLWRRRQKKRRAAVGPAGPAPVEAGYQEHQVQQQPMEMKPGPMYG